MLYSDGKYSYTLEKLMHIHSEEWKQILFNVLTIEIAVLANNKKRIKLKEVDIEGITSDIAEKAIFSFDKFLVNTKEYTKEPILDEYDGTDITLYQDIDYKVMLAPFEDFFNNIEVR